MDDQQTPRDTQERQDAFEAATSADVLDVLKAASSGVETAAPDADAPKVEGTSPFASANAHRDAFDAAASDAVSGTSAARFSTPSHVQEAYERAYYEAVGASAPRSDEKPAQEQAHSDPFVAAISDATGQRQEGASSYQQPWNSPGTAQAGQSYQQPWNGSGSMPGAAYGQGGYNSSGGGQQWSQTYTYVQGQAQRPYVVTKDHVAAGLLAIFLGGFGVHKFYLGYNTAAFIMLGVSILGSLFTFGLAGAVMGMIGFIEGIIYLTKNQSTFDAIYVYGRKEWF